MLQLYTVLTLPWRSLCSHSLQRLGHHRSHSSMSAIATEHVDESSESSESVRIGETRTKSEKRPAHQEDGGKGKCQTTTAARMRTDDLLSTEKQSGIDAGRCGDHSRCQSRGQGIERSKSKKLVGTGGSAQSSITRGAGEKSSAGLLSFPKRVQAVRLRHWRKGGLAARSRRNGSWVTRKREARTRDSCCEGSNMID